MNPAYVPAPSGRDARARVGGEARQVRLVHDRLAPGVAERPVALPVVLLDVDDHALHRARGVGRGARLDPSVGGGGRDRAAVRVEEDAGGVEAQSVVRVPRPVRGEAVELAGADPGDLDVPVVAGPVDRRVEPDDPGRGRVIDRVEQEQVEADRAPGVDAEVGAIGGEHRRPAGRDCPCGSRPRAIRLGPPGGRRPRARSSPGHSPTLACIIPPSTM